VPLLVWKIPKLKSPFMKYGGWVLFVFGLIALLVTFSRSAWIVASIGIAYVFFSQQKKYSRFLFSAAIIMCLGFALLLPSFGDEAVLRRAELNLSAIRLWQDSPFVGIGLGNFIVRLPETSIHREISFLQPVHNMYLLLLTETGLIGICAAIILFLAVVGHVIRRVLVKGVQSGGYSIYAVPLLTLLLLGFADHYMLTLQQGQLLLTLFISLTSISNTTDR
jgi:O-antigen ligase